MPEYGKDNVYLNDRMKTKTVKSHQVADIGYLNAMFNKKKWLKMAAAMLYPRNWLLEILSQLCVTV